MTDTIRLAALAAAVMIALGGCDRSHPADDGHDHDDNAAETPVPHDDDAGHADDDDVAEHGPGDGHDHGQAEEVTHVPHEDEGSESDEHAGHGHEADGSEDEHSEEVIRLDELELEEFGIRLATAGSGSLRQRTSLAGEVVLNPDRVAHVVARAGGIGADVLCTIGDRVEAGQTLAVLESPELAESKADYLAKAAQAELAATDLSRAETIHANTIRLLEVIAGSPGLDELRNAISGLDIGANRGALITAYAEQRAAEAVYERERTLFEREISSESEYLAAESELKKALASSEAVRDDLAFANRRELDVARRSQRVSAVSLQAAERRLHALGLDEDEVDAVADESDLTLARYEIRAPITGLVIERHLVRGESLTAGDQVIVVADLSSVWGQLTLYQRDLASVREGQTARIIGTHGLGDSQATIAYVSPILEEQTRTTTARVVLDNTGGDWRPGMFIRAEVVESQHPAGVVVPRSAIQLIGGETAVFVETPEGLERRDVSIGAEDAESVEVVGLCAGETYVVSGGLALKAELDKAALEHAGHAH